MTWSVLIAMAIGSFIGALIGQQLPVSRLVRWIKQRWAKQ
jgi:hypothetical protein